MTRLIGRAYVLLGIAVSALYLFVPATASAGILLIVVMTVGALIYGVHRFRPRRRLPWWLLAAGALSFTISSAVGAIAGSFPSAGDAIWFAVSLPAILFGFLGLSRSGAVSRDRAAMIDSLIVTAGAGFLAWVYLINPYLTDPGLTTLQKAVSVAYPLGDVLLLAVLARLALSARRSWNVLLLLVAGTAFLISDILFSLDGCTASGAPAG